MSVSENKICDVAQHMYVQKGYISVILVMRQYYFVFLVTKFLQ